MNRPSQADSDFSFHIPSFKTEKVARSQTYLKRLARSGQERLRWHEALLNMPLVWLRSQGEGVRVAVLDTGIDTDHPDLRDAIAEARDFTGEGIEDGNGHGTHCAGIIAARQNGLGFVGAAPRASLLIAKVLNNAGRGTLGGIVEAIEWAMNQDADIISMSLGGATTNGALYEAVHEALAEGKIIVAAAGNAGQIQTNTVGYPGRYGSVITVGSHDRNGRVSGFSSTGGEIDFLAPGEGIWSTYKNGAYARLSGTSMATPFVSAMAALILAKHRRDGSSRTPIETNEDMRNHLMRMAAHPGHHDAQRGYGPLLPFEYFAKI